jgi:cellulose synthase/poly-beta-1,6-N-acetylglucosamine synthase-like glycosyltransferase
VGSDGGPRRSRIEAAHLAPPLIPAQVAFLALEGVPIEILQWATAAAESLGTTPDRVLIARGLIGEDAFYAALARHLGIPFLRRPVPVDRARASMDSIHAGAVVLAPGPLRFAIAPQGRQIAAVLTRPEARLDGLAVMTPRTLAQSVWATIGASVITEAGMGVAHARPELSARGAAGPGAWVGVAAVLVTALVCAGPAPVAGLLSLALLLLFALTIGLRLVATRAAMKASPPVPPLLPDGMLPVYTVVVALWDEADMIPQLARALGQLDYPSEKLDVKILLEEADHATIKAAEAWPGPLQPQIIVCPAGRPRTKPRALNAALLQARGSLLVVFDAEDVPDPGQLRLAASVFAGAPDELACLQASLAIDNTRDSWLTRLFTIEYAALFDVLLPGLARLGLPMPLGGTSNHFRRSVLDGVLGWDPWNVTEDADLGIRLARFGYRVGTLPSVTHEEAPARLRDWLGQRTRWLKGWMQTTLVHARDMGSWRHTAVPARLAILAHTVGTVASALAYPVLLPLALVGLLDGSLLTLDDALDAALAPPAIAVLAMGPLAMLGPPVVAMRRKRLAWLMPWLFLLPVYYLLVSLAAWRAAWELLYAPSYWRKTRHGMARSSRIGLIPVQAARRLPPAKRP